VAEKLKKLILSTTEDQDIKTDVLSKKQIELLTTTSPVLSVLMC